VERWRTDKQGNLKDKPGPKITASPDKIARRMKPILNASARWTNGLGIVVNANLIR
jgi:hypothetical protein